MNLYEKIKTLYPDLQSANFTSVIILQNDNDGKGDYIAKWDHPTLPRPTQDQLDGIKD
jgi:XkdW protein